MGRFRQAGNPDLNEARIIRALVKMGCSVQRLSLVGGGCPDLLVAWGQDMVLLEVKNPKGKNRVLPSQKAWARRWKGPKPVVVESPAQACRVMATLAVRTVLA